jgi:hypothetical protein
MSKVVAVTFDKATKISKKLEAKLRALANASEVIKANQFTKGERIAVVNRLEEVWASGIDEHLPDAEDYLAILRGGHSGWVDSTDAELAEELIGMFGDQLRPEEEQQ